MSAVLAERRSKSTGEKARKKQASLHPKTVGSPGIGGANQLSELGEGGREHRRTGRRCILRRSFSLIQTARQLFLSCSSGEVRGKGLL